MATLPSTRFGFVAKAGDELKFTSTVSVSAEGMFSMSAPNELEEIVRGICRKGLKALYGASCYMTTQQNFRVQAPTLQLCKDLIGIAGKEWAECVVTTETVILYSYDAKVAYYKGGDGEFYPNGVADRARSGKWHGELNGSMGYDSFYRIGLAAVIRNKFTYTRNSSVKVEYKESLHKTPHHLDVPDTWHDRLKGFVGLHPNLKGMKEMPYTEEAARFFYEMMMSMCKLADRLTDFFSSEDNITMAIQQQASPLALPYRSDK